MKINLVQASVVAAVKAGTAERNPSPQGLKPGWFYGLYGTTEVVP
jgi:hypothetical protein